MALKKVLADELILSFSYKKGSADFTPVELFPGQDRVEKAFDLALSASYDGYNVFVSGPESVGRTVYTLKRLKEASQNKPPPEDVCYVNNFENPLRPLYLLLPAGMGRKLSQDIDRAIEDLKEALPKAFESKEYEEEIAKINKMADQQRERIIQELGEEAQKHNLGVLFTPAGIRLLPIMGRRLVSEEELLSNEKLQEAYERNLSAFEERFREFMRKLRELDHNVADQILDLRRRVAYYVVEKVFSRFENGYKSHEHVRNFINRLKEEIVKSADLFMLWHTSKGNPAAMRSLERAFNAFRVNVIVDNSDLKGLPVVHEEVPTLQNLFGRVSYTVEMGVLQADHMSISAGSLHRARGGYLVLRAIDLLKNPYLWNAFKKVLMHKKIHMAGGVLEDSLLPYVGISPEPVPADIKVFLIGDPLLYQLLSLYDPEFNRLFKVKAEFNPIIDLNEDFVESFPKIIKKIIVDEGIKDLTAEALSELLRYAVTLSGSRKKVSLLMGYIVDVIREANTLSGDSQSIDAKHIKRAIEEKIYRSNLIEEKIRKAIEEGKIIVKVDGRHTGQVNGLSVYELGDISFGKPSRISASVYIGEKGVINIEREVELSGPIHSKGVLILTGYIGNKYGKDFPIHLSCNITFEQSYEEVEGDSASVAELIAILSAISGIPVRQDIAITGSVDQHGNIQPVGGIKEKVEGFYKVCKVLGLTGQQGVVVPSRNYDNLILDDELIDHVKAGRFHIYTAESIDDVIELMFDMKAEQFHKLVSKKLYAFYKKVAKPKEKG
ncbi:MAG: AAA family ATPase [Hydrogenobacter thermophilus]|uniref:Lon protease family protein n=1 Tax=Hydrogenobacter thermophilus TaxID=940 RepID=UPI001C7516F1|nr:ATP-binding protein [Hydrogenobacter thermophilus]QWK20090.1 MAG: AAA family ATPase [Hydrogenobacter thermophilus]